LAIICGSIDFWYELGLELNIGVVYWKVLKNPWFLQLQRTNL
jgi:hypothetical protein